MNLNGILAATLNQEIINVYHDIDKNLKKLDITYMLKDAKNDKNIVYITEIGANKFNIKLEDKIDEKQVENTEKQRLRRTTIGNMLRKMKVYHQMEKTKKLIRKIYII